MRPILLIALALIVSCSTSSSYNPTVFEYNYNTELIAEKPIKKVILAPVNLGAPPPSHLRKGERKIKAMVKNYLTSNG